MKKILLSGVMLASLLTSQKSFSQTSCALNPDFSDPNPTRVVDAGGSGGGYEAGDVYIFHNVLFVAPDFVNAEVRIESMVNAEIFDLDNNAINPERLAPVIMSNSTNTEGHVQFAVTFRRASDNSVINLSSLRMTNYNLYGEDSPTYDIRETSWVTGAALTFNSPTSLIDAGSSIEGSTTWRKVLSPLSAAAIVDDPAYSFVATYAPASTFRFRVGYNHNQWLTGGHSYNIGFNCLTVAENIPLPLTLLNFNGSYANNKSILNWQTQSEVNVDRFEVERSSDGNNFTKINSVIAKGASGTNDYQLTEDMTNIAGGIFYYRLKSVDKDGKFTYSKVVALRRDTKLFNQISITPNPIINGNGVIKITATSMGTADVKIVDFAGRIIMLQKVNLFEGVNVLPINVARQLSAGVYSLQLFKGGEVLNSKFVVGR